MADIPCQPNSLMWWSSPWLSSLAFWVMTTKMFVTQGLSWCQNSQSTVGLQLYLPIVMANILDQLNSMMCSSPLCQRSLVPWEMTTNLFVMQALNCCQHLQNMVSLKPHCPFVMADVSCQLNFMMCSSPLCQSSLVPWGTTTNLFVMWGLRCYQYLWNTVGLKPYCPIVKADILFQLNSMTQSRPICLNSSVS